MITLHGLMTVNGVRAPIGEENNEVGKDPVYLMTRLGQGGTLPTIREFQSLVGSLLRIARCTRPDSSFAVHKATR